MMDSVRWDEISVHRYIGYHLHKRRQYAHSSIVAMIIFERNFPLSDSRDNNVNWSCSADQIHI